MARKSSRGALLIAVFVSLALLLYAAAWLLSTRAFVRRAVSVRGEVVGVVSREGSRYFAVSLPTGAAGQSLFIPKSSFSWIGPGDTLALLYDAEVPADARIDSFFSLWLLPLLLCAGGLAGLVYAGRALSGHLVPRGKALRLGKRPFADLFAPGARTASSVKPVAPRREINSSESAQLFGILQQYVDDPEVSDIIVSNHSKVSVKRGGATSSTAISFADHAAYENYVERLLLAAGVTYSIAKPVVDGMIGPSIRIHAVNPVLCESGPYLTIRISRFNKVGIAELCRDGLAPRVIFDYLQSMILSGHTLMVAGEVGTGKTTLARALGAVFPPSESILVIEDTPELAIEHANVRYIRTREANVAGYGEIALSECIRAGLRMAMSRIILGEIRDADAAQAFLEVCSSGHPGLSTIHARSAADALNRLELLLGRAQPGTQREILREQIATALQCVIYLQFCAATGKRRIVEVKEFRPSKGHGVEEQSIFSYEVFDGMPGWRVLSKSSFFERELGAVRGHQQLSALPAVFGL